MSDTPRRYDLAVIGGGPAGEKGAAQAAYFGKRVALIEAMPHLGGAGVKHGDHPVEDAPRERPLLLRPQAARPLRHRRQPEEGRRGPGLPVPRAGSRAVVREVVRQNVERHHIDLIHGRASFVDAHRLAVAPLDGGATVTVEANVILVATGSVPSRGHGIPFDDPRVHDSDEILDMQKMPRSMAVVGAGVIGCEYATVRGARDQGHADRRPRPAAHVPGRRDAHEAFIRITR